MDKFLDVDDVDSADRDVTRINFKHADAHAVKGAFTVNVYKRGHLVAIYADHNLVVNTGRKRFAELIAGKSSNCIAKIGVGTGTSTEQLSDTSLRDQQLFDITSSSIDGSDAVFNWTITTEQANGLDISEFGLFTRDDVMVTHRVRTRAIGKDRDIELTGEYRLSF